MISLGASPDVLAKYQPLTREQLKITAARIDPSLRGTRNSSLAWFWTVDVQGDCQTAEGIEECNVILDSSQSHLTDLTCELFSLQGALVESESAS